VNSVLTKRTLLIPRMEKFPLSENAGTRRAVHDNARRSPKILAAVRKNSREGSARAARTSL
jgi:hypothetical protein